MNFEKNECGKITVSMPMSIFPPLYGGQLRIYHLYRYLAQWFDIELVTYVSHHKAQVRKEIAPGLWEIQVPLSQKHMEKQHILNVMAGRYVGDSTLHKFYHLSPDYINALEESSKDADVVIVSHPYTYYVVKEVGVRKIWYDAHNVEYELKKSIYEDTPMLNEILQELKQMEKECCENSQLIMACSEEDKDKFVKMYGITPEKICIVPNGVDIRSKKCIFPSQRKEFKKKIRNDYEYVAVFIGSNHPPNIIAVQEILKLAKELVDTEFIIIGSVAEAFKEVPIPMNVRMTGLIEEEEKDYILSYADMALNPMPYGSGTHLKMIEYFSMGLPVISTKVGTRGLEVQDHKHLLICELDEFKETIKRFESYSDEQKIEMITRAREHVISQFDWSMIAKRLINHIQQNKLLDVTATPRYLPEDYIDPSTQIKKLSLNMLREKMATRPIMLWGAGGGGKQILNILKQENIIVQGIIDKDPEENGTMLEGIQVFSPEYIIKHEGNKPFIIITSGCTKDISNHLVRLGYIREQDFIEQNFSYPSLCLL